MRKQIKKLIWRMIVLLFLTIAVGGFLCALVFDMLPIGSDFGEYFSSSLVNSEILYVILALAVVLVVTLAFMLMAVRKTVSIFVSFSKSIVTSIPLRKPCQSLSL